MDICPIWGLAIASAGGGMTRGTWQSADRGAPLRFSRTFYISGVPAVVGVGSVAVSSIEDYRVRNSVVAHSSR